MSSSQDLAALIQVVQEFTALNYIDVTVFTVIIYDSFLTCSDEMRIIWRRPVTGAKVLFLLNRYTFIISYIVIFMNQSATFSNNQRCSILGNTLSLFGVLHDLVVSVFQILRVYAITGRRWRYTLLVGVFNIFPQFLTIYQWSKSASVPASAPIPEGCETLFFVPSQNSFNDMVIAQRVSLIVADIVTVAVTVYQTYDTMKASRDANIRATFSSALLRAGILYFGVMFVMNTTDFIVLLRTNVNYFDDFPVLFDYLLISHFLLNLQDMASTTTDDSNLSRPSFVRSTQGPMSSIHFADSIIGNLGENLRDISHDEDDEDVDMDDENTVRNDEVKEPASTPMPTSNNIWENTAGPSRLSMNDMHVRRMTGMMILLR